MSTLEYPFARPYPSYLDGRWYFCGRGTLLTAQLVPYLVFDEEHVPDLPHPTEAMVTALLDELTADTSGRPVRYLMAHPHAASEVYQAGDELVLVGATWGRVLSKCDRLTLSDDGVIVLGWLERAGKLQLVAAVATNPLPVVHGWVRLDDETVSATRRRTKAARPSRWHRLVVRDLYPHPWEHAISGVQLGWGLGDTSDGSVTFEDAPLNAWPFREQVVSLGDLRAAKLCQ